MKAEFESVLVPAQAILKEVLAVIDRSGLGVALVANDHRQLMGLVTDGDLRRAILEGRALDTPVHTIMNTDPVTARAGTSRQNVLAMMDYVIRHIPVLDESRRVCDLVCFNELSRNIPFAVPNLGEEEECEVVDAFRSTWLSMGPRVRAFEEQVASYLGTKHAIAVNSGTAALDVALKVLGIRPGDEVIIPAFTYIATANAVLYQHAVPVFADIDPRTFNIDPNEVVERITAKTKCLISIDYGGHSADYDALRRITEEHGIYLLQDGAHSIGADYKGQKLCTLGAINTISFHAAKVVTSIEGGMIITDDDDFASAARIIRNQGEDPAKKYHHVLLGHNYRMTDLHAAIGLRQFARLSDLLKKRKEVADYYTRQLNELRGAVTIPHVEPEITHAWFFYPILVNNRDEVVHYLKSKGIDTRIAWPLPVNKQPVYAPTHGHLHYPVTEAVSSRILNLPIYPEMTDRDLDYVIIHLKDAIAQTAGIRA
ncbi:MAG: aminotransferase class I/II-fold pyridoxal phosphate-dependent enzyme [Actinomycetota bacterium]